MPHFMCTVCNTIRPKDRTIGQEHDELGWICPVCSHRHTFEALRVIASLNTCSNCSIKGTNLDGAWFNQEKDWYCDVCTYELRGPAAGQE